MFFDQSCDGGFADGRRGWRGGGEQPACSVSRIVSWHGVRDCTVELVGQRGGVGCGPRGEGDYGPFLPMPFIGQDLFDHLKDRGFAAAPWSNKSENDTGSVLDA